MVAPERVLSMGQIELDRGFESFLFLYLNCVFMQNWIIWNRTGFDIETVLSETEFLFTFNCI